METTLKVTGLRELSVAFKRMGDGLPKELAQVHKDVARLVTVRSRSLAASLGGTAAKAAPSIRGTGSATRTVVSIGNPAHPYGAGAELGAIHDQPRRTVRGTVKGWNQFPARNIEGYVVGPALRDPSTLDDVEREYTQGLDRLIKRAGLD